MTTLQDGVGHILHFAEIQLLAKGALDIGYAHLFIDDVSSNLAYQEAAGAPPTGNLVGTYKASVNILSLQYRHSF